MNIDWFNTTIATGMSMLIIGFIFYFGGNINEQEWQKDCTQMGTHRVKDVVYKCGVIK
jgi:hypothetical protein